MDRRQRVQVGPPRGFGADAAHPRPMRNHFLRRRRRWLPRQGRRLWRPHRRALHALVPGGRVHALLPRPCPPRLEAARAVDIRRRDHCPPARDWQAALPAAKLLVHPLLLCGDYRHADDAPSLGRVPHRPEDFRHGPRVHVGRRATCAASYLAVGHLRHRLLPGHLPLVRHRRRNPVHGFLRGDRECANRQGARVPAGRHHCSPPDAATALLGAHGSRPVHPRYRARR
mmetsp:Transcript_4809/g.10386  ORF Transcript_4809/g.10386 Transcript_4809/m.10386 type:complete len:228 (+) Transcript_4809:939-1622(+)